MQLFTFLAYSCYLQLKYVGPLLWLDLSLAISRRFVWYHFEWFHWDQTAAVIQLNHRINACLQTTYLVAFVLLQRCKCQVLLSFPSSDGSAPRAQTEYFLTHSQLLFYRKGRFFIEDFKDLEHQTCATHSNQRVTLTCSCRSPSDMQKTNRSWQRIEMLRLSVDAPALEELFRWTSNILFDCLKVSASASSCGPYLKLTFLAFRFVWLKGQSLSWFHCRFWVVEKCG